MKEPIVPMDRRWKIICPSYTGTFKKAAAIVNEVISADVHYIPEVVTSAEDKNCNLVVIGAPDNELVSSLLGEKPQKDGYIVKVWDNPFAEGRKVAVITGYGPAEVLYAAADFADDYKALARRSDRCPMFRAFNHPSYQNTHPDYYINTVPFVKRRGIWTWGHSIYDYKKFFDNMARIKLNRVTIWNDFVPLNMEDVIDYAHSLGISVVLGFSWGWRTEIDISDMNNLPAWSDSVVKNYQENYAHLNHDGIYFQTFTETTKSNLNGKSIAETAVEWTNSIGSRLLELYPDLEIQFGLHATSVRDSLDAIAKVDPRISIVWEDCGAFPWHYVASETDDFAETAEFTKKIANLRGGKAVGGVFKGQVCLDWTDFEHQTGPFIMGENPERADVRRDLGRKIVKQNQSWWFENADCVAKIVQIMGADADLSDLFEDGLLEEHIWFTAALYAEILWTGGKDTTRSIQKVSERGNVVFA